jgi:hypothetical protein
VEEPKLTTSKEGAAGLEFNKELAHWFFFGGGDMKEIVHGEFVPPNNTVNSDLYCDVLRCLRENVR